MQRKLTRGSDGPPRAMTYSMDAPMSGSFTAVNNTPPELMFFVSPDCIRRSGPLRVIETGN